MFDAPWHWIVVVIVLAALFGYKRLPDMSRSVARSLRIFKTEMKGLSDDDAARNSQSAPDSPYGANPYASQPVASQPVASQPVAMPPVAMPPVVAPPVPAAPPVPPAPPVVPVAPAAVPHTAPVAAGEQAQVEQPSSPRAD